MKINEDEFLERLIEFRKTYIMDRMSNKIKEYDEYNFIFAHDINSLTIEISNFKDVENITNIRDIVFNVVVEAKQIIMYKRFNDITVWMKDDDEFDYVLESRKLKLKLLE